MSAKPLSAEQLCRKTDPSRLPFDTTQSLPETDAPVGQERALRALAFGARIAKAGYNIFVSGPAGTGKHTSIRRALERLAATMPTPPDWCYVHNFNEPHRPKPIAFPAGQGAAFKAAMTGFVTDLKAMMPRLLESEEYKTRRRTVEDDFRDTLERALGALRQAAESKGLLLLEQEAGFHIVPQRNGQALSEIELRQLPREERDLIAERTRELRSALDAAKEELAKLHRRTTEELRRLERELGERELRALMKPLAGRFETVRDAHAYLESVFRDVMGHMDALQDEARADHDARERRSVPFHRYEVNLLVNHGGTKGAPVVSLPLPSLSHLVGKVEHVPLLMTMVTDFMFIRPGALHDANGGFLLIDALDLLRQDVSWETLKRSLKEGRVRIENLAEILDRSQTVTIQPEPIPLDVKIVLFGELWLFHRLRELDPDFADLFKVQADFSSAADRDEMHTVALLGLLAGVARREGLKHLDRSGAARFLDEASRMAGDAEKLCVRTARLADLLREADHFAGEAARSLIVGQDVSRAVAAREDRAGRIKALEQEFVRRGIVLVDTDGARIGQVNALTVLSVAGYAFGVPARVTAQVRPGDGGVTDIERLAAFSGPSHAKGVQILAGYLNGHYSITRGLSLSASIAFEQSYGPIDGDSASAAELLAILSAIADVPLRQGIAITGSINQRGMIQPIGGVNEKIEGFFDICAMRGLRKEHGVIIPKANLVNLMLRDEVAEAVGRGVFAVYAVETIDDAIDILAPLKAGARTSGGSFPRQTFNRKVADRLLYFGRPRLLKPLRLDRWWPF